MSSDSPARLVSSIGHGAIQDDNNESNTTTPSWAEFNALAQQTRAMQERIDTIEKQQQQKPASIVDEGVGLLGSDEDNKSPTTHQQRTLGVASHLTESTVEAMYDEYELPESSYSLLMTEKIVSVPFFTGIFSAFLSMFALILALKNELDNGEQGNFLGLPAGVPEEVRLAQYFGIFIGVLMEDEIPTGLELIGKGVEQRMVSASRSTRHLYAEEGIDMKRIVLPALLRLLIGYTFLFALFLVVVQESTVLDIFFDVLALEFVESIDDVIFSISKRGFFGRRLRVATNDLPTIKTGSESHKLRRWTKRFIRIVYILNICIGIGGLTYLTVTQKQGKYRCQSVTISFGDDTFEEAYVTNEDGVLEKRLLIFSHFNGVYVENGTHNGRPKYTEMNKEDGDPFQVTVPAEIIYCEDIEAWVFQHQNIRTSPTQDEENDCSWLLKSQNTDSYDIIELAEETEWFMWKGLVESEYRVSIECNECDDDGESCNYNGVCIDEKCECYDEHFGTFCQFKNPCDVIRTEKDPNVTLNILADPNDDEVDFVEVYGRPVYVIRNMQGKPYSFLRQGYPDDGEEYYNVEHPPNSNGTDLAPHKHYQDQFFEDDDFFEINNQSAAFQTLMNNYTFVLAFTGRRWYGKLVSPDVYQGNFKEEEFHGFWDNAFSGTGTQDNSTLIISAPASNQGSPVGLDFFEMRRRNIAFESGIYDYEYGPFGVLIPLVEYEGSGFFHCNRND